MEHSHNFFKERKKDLSLAAASWNGFLILRKIGPTRIVFVGDARFMIDYRLERKKERGRKLAQESINAGVFLQKQVVFFANLGRLEIKMKIG